ncbi:MAG: hypothetical protein EAZ98_06355 [Oscillatoriales cyanobacterium]|uniref:Uncharacterized protein n=1 Tax=Microcoleus anatoxicus PTRS2 TaxID=2705321 RepID=A0ABU8YHQ4_9CYAN|nr:MAG: hypothetical protein EA000_05655 [Oscillatoriales cyanobacterium]TAD98547.1 MAG: hypothetical protein EAZ98_06355 [Oscillatoriales cyanobacterium]TAE05706.1 MAG: hypothetical protein EAZ96_04540 [Oscillatoriales cyanobacterium]
MPIEKVPNTSLNYYLIAFDKDGNERDEADGKKLSEQIFSALANEPITDVFLMSHGWMGDIPAARNQYNDWIGAMAKQTADLEKIKQVRSEFNPLLIGLHWPSKPWGNEDLTSSVSFDINDEDPREQLVDEYASRIANTEAARQALHTILNSASEDNTLDSLPPEVLSAYQVLNQEADLGTEGEGGAPGSDWEGFDPEAIYEASKDEPVSFSTDSSSVWDKVLDPLRVLSYWKMKERARQIGENSGFNLLKTLQEKAAETVRFHLMGHSFGCIVVSSILSGPKGKGILVRPVDSLALVQGAVSLWSYCSKISYERDRPGYFNTIIAQSKVAGPIVTTHSQFDYAVGRMYPLAGKTAFSSVDFAPGQLPKYGGIGSFGLGGDDLAAENTNMLPCDASYDFKPGKIYNLESSKFICNVELGGPTSGAHCDIAKPEVAHAVWSAAYPT